MENLTPWQIILICIGLFMGACTAVNTIGTAVEKISKARKVVAAPNDVQNARLDSLEAWREEVDRERKRDHNHFLAIDDGYRVTLLALLALLDHGIDGNNIEQMQKAKAALQTHLIDR